MSRTSHLNRETGETKVSVTLTLEGKGHYRTDTGNGMLDHLLAQLARHSLMDLIVDAKGDVGTGWHHLVEDVAITVGRSLREAIGEGKGIRRMGHAAVPLDEALALVAVDLGGRSHAAIHVDWAQERVEDLPGDLVRHFLEAFAVEARITLHARVVSGLNAHHQAEALFKALAKALRDATELDPRLGEEIPSTKGTIQG